MASVSSSNWLDRLRSSRGFPTGDEPDLGRFLSSSSSGSAPTTESTQSESTQSKSTIRDRENNSVRQNDEQWSNVLCDLFNMGEESSRTFSKKSKSSRKQANPRFCGANENNNDLCSSDDLRRENNKSDNNGLASSGDNSLNERREKSAAGEAKFDAGAEERENEDVDLKAYSRNEVFVIDTSLNDWKFDGWVFRKNDEWRIKEKKGKARVSGGKKRKLLVSALNNENLGKDQKKKKKMMNSDGVSLLLLDKAQPQNEKKYQPFKETTDSLGKVPQKRCPCPRPPEKFGNEGSSVILLKSIPLNNISEAPRLGKSSQKKCPKKMKIL